MARCFLTGVEFRVEDGHVLNRTDAQRLLRTLRQRSESLERLLVQLSPFDEPAAQPRSASRGRGRQHRMLCKAVANALAQAYPEIELFLSWPELLARDLRYRMRLLKEHPLYGPSISELPDEELVTAAKLGQQVIRLLDRRRELSYRAKLAIRAGVCIRHRSKNASAIVALIRSTILDSGSFAPLGVHEEDLDAVRTNLSGVLGAPPRDTSRHEGQ